MAYYPLKVKDNSGNVHVVGDPRIADKADKASPTFTGTPAAPTAAADTNTTQVATTAFVAGQAGTATPLANGTATVGTSLRYARQDHRHAMPSASDVGAIGNSVFTGARQLLSSSGASTPVAIAIEDDQLILSNQVFN